jgi:hypothetical protein
LTAATAAAWERLDLRRASGQESKTREQARTLAAKSKVPEGPELFFMVGA